MVSFNTMLLKFGQKGEKTGWVYIDIPSQIAEEIKPHCKKSFRVKGTIDNHQIKWVSLLPMGEGNFILAVNNTMRKEIKKKEGAMVNVSLEEDIEEKKLDQDLIDCLVELPIVADKFYKLPKSHQMYYSNWIASAKSIKTKSKRIHLTIITLEKELSFAQMLQMNKDKLL